MKLLLDTQAFLWYCAGSSRLSVTARSAIESGENERLLSVASLWEIAIKLSIGKLELSDSFEPFVREGLLSVQCVSLAVELPHLTQLASLPFHHRDPFDRLIVSQAICEQVPLVSIDTDFDPYDVERIW